LFVCRWFENFILLAIIANCIFIAMDNPLNSKDSTETKIVEKTEIVFAVIFTLEMVRCACLLCALRCACTPDVLCVGASLALQLCVRAIARSFRVAPITTRSKPDGWLLWFRVQALKWLALGFFRATTPTTPGGYFTDSWNRMDFIIGPFIVSTLFLRPARLRAVSVFVALLLRLPHSTAVDVCMALMSMMLI
jgi:urea transporter